jgi:hypothetical protein
MGAAWIDQKTGQLVLLNNEARITKDIVDERNRQLANDRIAHDLKQSNASLDKNLEQRGKSIQSVSGMEEQAGVLRMNTMIAYSQGRLTLEEYWKEMSLIKVKTDETYRAVEDTITSSVDRVGKGMLDFATKQIKGWTDVRDGVRGMIADILADIAKLIIKLEIEKPLMDYFKGESGSGWLSAFAGIFTGKAAGGNVSAGTPYTVGERGPETFVPGANGSIVPNGAGAGSGSVTIIVSVDNKGNETAPADAQSSANGLSEGLRQAVVQELYNQARTGGYLWKMKHQGAG